MNRMKKEKLEEDEDTENEDEPKVNPKVSKGYYEEQEELKKRLINSFDSLFRIYINLRFFLSLNDALKSFDQNDEADKDDFLKVKTKTKEESVRLQ